MRMFVTVATTAALLISLTASRATPQKPLQFGTSADLVLIDLIATDGDGRRVTDLRAEEIEIYEDGKRQPIEMLRFIGDGTLDATPASPPPPPLPRHPHRDSSSRSIRAPCPPSCSSRSGTRSWR